MAPSNTPTDRSPASVNAGQVADVYLLALRDLQREIVQQGEQTRAMVADCIDHVLALSARVDVLESRLVKDELAIESLKAASG